MSETEVTLRTPSPRTRQSLATELHQVGLASGMTVMVHSSLSSLGWVCGGSVTVVQALMDVVTAAGTLVSKRYKLLLRSEILMLLLRHLVKLNQAIAPPIYYLPSLL